MPDTCQEFQQTVSQHLVRHRSVLDVMSKLQQACANANRAIVKTVTDCGCLKIEAGKQPVPENATLPQVAEYVKSHLNGKLCSNCAEVLEAELGTTLFYLAAVCTLFDLNLEKIIAKENDRISTLGVFSLT